MKEFILVHQPGSVEPTVIRKSLIEVVESADSELHGKHTVILLRSGSAVVTTAVTESPDEIFKKLNEE